MLVTDWPPNDPPGYKSANYREPPSSQVGGFSTSAQMAPVSSEPMICGAGVYECANILLKRFGDKVAIAMIGPGGRRVYQPRNSKYRQRPNALSINARVVWCLMGAKRLKAIIVEAHGGQKPRSLIWLDLDVLSSI